MASSVDVGAFDVGVLRNGYPIKTVDDGAMLGARALSAQLLPMGIRKLLHCDVTAAVLTFSGSFWLSNVWKNNIRR